MPRLLVQLVAMILLGLQGLISLAPGQTLCLPLRDCGSHDPSGTAACGHCDLPPCDEASTACAGHDHGPPGDAFHADDDCGCHLHVPVPSSDQLPSGPQRGDGQDVRTAAAAILVVATMRWDFGPATARPGGPPPRCFVAMDQVRSLKTTRLLI